MSDPAWDDLVARVGPLDVEPVVPITWVETRELIISLALTKRELYELGEGLVPRTDRGRELHSHRAAVAVEIRRRLDPG